MFKRAGNALDRGGARRGDAHGRPGAIAPAAAQGTGKCPLAALKKADKPVEITFWHSMPQANEETLTALTDQFNSSQSDVKVTLVNQTSTRTR